MGCSARELPAWLQGSPWVWKFGNLKLWGCQFGALSLRLAHLVFDTLLILLFGVSGVGGGVGRVVWLSNGVGM